MVDNTNAAATATVATMAPADIFFDLSLLPDNSSNFNTSTSTCLLAAAAAHALNLGYSARPHSTTSISSPSTSPTRCPSASSSPCSSLRCRGGYTLGSPTRSPLIADPTSRRQLIAQAKAAAVPFIKQKGIDKNVEFFKDTMELDGTKSSKMKLIANASMTLSSDDNLACSALPCNMELSDISIQNKYSHQSSGILDYAKACAECDCEFISCERVDWALQNHDIPSGSNVFA
ncbi:hypothetical protein ABZP36_009323 [Zizania latifolia]